ncbi:hypothetical protein P879_11996 [Paragonimus westermani]|uniref:Uncharacterized protein n=1 Tax=Paragonimus westermani TaxID=34504 RepID=A0A8T0D8K0_9TREM|nr:hypothetical protein P879_11996 [Paragonimus westermani]
MSKQLRIGLSGGRLRTHNIGPNASTSPQLPVDLDESAETASPQTPTRPFSGDDRDGSGMNGSAGAQQHAPLDKTLTQTSVRLLAEAHRVLSNNTNPDAAAVQLLTTVNNQLHKPTNLGHL